MSKRPFVAAGIGSLLLAIAPAPTAAAPHAARPAHPVQVSPAAPNGSWTTYHHDDAHTGYDSTAATVTAVQPTPGWTTAALDGEVYAEVLVYNGLVFAATLNNTVYALNQATGQVVWSNHLGTPQGGGWQCGNISQSGILGTPVIDTSTNRIYAAGEVTGSPPIFRLWGIDLNTGLTVFNSPILPPGFDWRIQQERGALALANGFAYVPFGGRAGDCFDMATSPATPYYGYVAAVPVGGGTTLFYRTPSTAESVWAAGGITVDDVSHNIFFATGNAIPCGGAQYSDAVVRLNPTLGSPTFFEPNDWQSNWCGPDSDLGSANPLLISPNLLFQAGKHGGGFLLDPTNLGGVDGQVYPPRTPYAQADVCLGNTSDATFGAFAYAAPFVYVECEGRGIVALRVDTVAKTFTPCSTTCGAPDWVAGGSNTFGPPIVAGGAVWAANGSGLYAFNAASGAQIYHSAGFGINRFVTPTEAGGQVFVPSSTVVRSFSFGVTLAPRSLDFGTQTPGTTSAPQTVTLYNIQSSTLNVTSAAITGAGAGAYVKGSDTCTGAVVAAGGTCAVQVSFKPTAFGGYPANLTFTDGAPGSPRSAALNGSAVADNQGHLYTLDGWGGLHNDGSAPSLNPSAYWPGWNIARSVAVFPDGSGGYTLDGWGGLHEFGSAHAVSASGYWPGWDIARQVVLAPWATAANPAGWTLDGWGGIHEFGGAPAISGYTWWPNWDIARGIAILPDSTPGSVAGYTLDGWGGIHPFGGASAITPTGYWPWWDIARGIALSPTATKANASGYTLDGWGGVHEFGNAPAVAVSGYWPYWDIARGIVTWSASGTGSGGWVLDGWGGIHPFGNAPTVHEGGYWPGWDIATGLGGLGSNSGSRRRT